MPIPSFPLAGDLLTQARKESSVGTNPVSAAMQDTAMYQRLQELDEEGVSYPASVGVFGWPFLDTETVISTIASTTLSGGIAAGASSLTLASGSGWDSPSSGISAGYIKTATNVYDFFTYESRLSAALSGVANVSMAHLTGEEVHKIEKLPTDFGYPRALYRQSVFYQYQNVDAALRQIPAHPYYMIKFLSDDSYSGQFLVFPYKIGALDWTLLYQKGSVNLDDAASPSTMAMSLPKGHGRRFYVEGLKQYIYEVEGELDDAKVAAGRKLEALNRLIDQYNLLDMAGQQVGITLSDW